MLVGRSFESSSESLFESSIGGSSERSSLQVRTLKVPKLSVSDRYFLVVDGLDRRIQSR